jgi:hypothetical protein
METAFEEVTEEQRSELRTDFSEVAMNEPI